MGSTSSPSDPSSARLSAFLRMFLSTGSGSTLAHAGTDDIKHAANTPPRASHST